MTLTRSTLNSGELERRSTLAELDEEYKYVDFLLQNYKDLLNVGTLLVRKQHLQHTLEENQERLSQNNLKYLQTVDKYSQGYRSVSILSKRKGTTVDTLLKILHNDVIKHVNDTTTKT